MTKLLKKMLPVQSEFSRRHATWANNHRGWAKLKKCNRRLAKSKMKQEVAQQIQEGTNESVGNDLCNHSVYCLPDVCMVFLCGIRDVVGVIMDAIFPVLKYKAGEGTEGGGE